MSFFKKRRKANKQQFTCRVSDEIKRLEQELKRRECDVPALARLTLKDAFEKALAEAEESTDTYFSGV